MSIYHIVYRTVNTVNNKYYYGVHSTQDLDDGYLGSGVLLKQAIAKYGPHNFKRDIVKFFDTREEAFLYESILVNESVVTDNSCYNLCTGGNGSVGSIVPDNETREKMSLAQKNRHAVRGNPNKGRKLGPRDPSIYERIQQTKAERGVTQATRTGAVLDDSTKAKMRAAALARPRHTCPHCSKSVPAQALARYHGDRCSLAPTNLHASTDLG